MIVLKTFAGAAVAADAPALGEGMQPGLNIEYY